MVDPILRARSSSFEQVHCPPRSDGLVTGVSSVRGGAQPSPRVGEICVHAEVMVSPAPRGLEAGCVVSADAHKALSRGGGGGRVFLFALNIITWYPRDS